MSINQALTKNDIRDLLKDLTRLIPYSEIAQNTELREEELRELAEGKRFPSPTVAWRIVSTCNKLGFFEILPPHGISPVTFDLSSPFHLREAPIGFDLDPPLVPSREERTMIASHPVDFPLGLPASILAANSKWIEFYARRGFDILTYKTARTRYEKGHGFPYWVFLKDPQKITDPSNPPVMKGYEGYWPKDTTTISMANSFGIPSFTPDRWQEDIQRARKVVKEGHQVLIVSIVSSVPEGATISTMINDFVAAAHMAREAGAQIIEANYSCPNVQGEHDDLYKYTELSANISKTLRDELRDTPLFVKIGYLPEPKLREFMKSNAKFINGIVAINTISVKIVNKEDKQTFPGRKTAGVSGWAIKERAQEVAKNLVALREELKLGDDFVLFGLGGMLTKEDYEERKATGVTAVESRTGAFLNPNLGLEIRRLDRGSIIERETHSAFSTLAEKGRGALQSLREKVSSFIPGVPNHSRNDAGVIEHSLAREKNIMPAKESKHLFRNTPSRTPVSRIPPEPGKSSFRFYHYNDPPFGGEEAIKELEKEFKVEINILQYNKYMKGYYVQVYGPDDAVEAFMSYYNSKEELSSSVDHGIA